MSRVTSRHGIYFIKNYEKCRLTAYQDSGGIWTIGYGHTLTAEPLKLITEKEAEVLLQEDLVFVETYINMQKLDLNQNKYDALCSFVFNLGVGNFKSSTLLKKIKQNPNDLTIAYEFTRWHKVNKVGLLGLLRRRTEESKLYFT